MNRKKLQKEIVKRLDKLHRFAKLIAETHNEEDIHKFRVNYKKLRALLRMIHNKRKEVLPEKLKQLYTTAGTIRDMQLHYKAVSNYFGQQTSMPVMYINHILQMTTAACNDFDQLYKHCSFKRLSGVIKEDIQGKHYRLTHWQQDNIKPLSLKKWHPVTDNAIHNIRKHVKDLLYTQKYLHPEKDYSLVADSLGNYIDHCILLKLLEANIHHAPADEQAMLEEAGNQWQQQDNGFND